jgi:hypothetical protein
MTRISLELRVKVAKHTLHAIVSGSSQARIVKE